MSTNSSHLRLPKHAANYLFLAYTTFIRARESSEQVELSGDILMAILNENVKI